MKTLTQPMTASQPGPKRWTVPEFHRLWEAGYFDGRKAMLLDGEIIDVPIPGPLHHKGVGKVDYALKRAFPANCWVRIQLPLELNLWIDPVPDVAVVHGSPDDYDVNPSAALLVVEISDSTLAMGLANKMDLYAAAGISDYWVLDLGNRLLIVHRDPGPDVTASSGFRYQNVSRLDASATIAPLAQPGSTISMGDLLPRPLAHVEMS